MHQTIQSILHDVSSPPPLQFDKHFESIPTNKWPQINPLNCFEPLIDKPRDIVSPEVQKHGIAYLPNGGDSLMVGYGLSANTPITWHLEGGTVIPDKTRYLKLHLPFIHDDGSSLSTAEKTGRIMVIMDDMLTIVKAIKSLLDSDNPKDWQRCPEVIFASAPQHTSNLEKLGFSKVLTGHIGQREITTFEKDIPLYAIPVTLENTEGLLDLLRERHKRTVTSINRRNPAKQYTPQSGQPRTTSY